MPKDLEQFLLDIAFTYCEGIVDYEGFAMCVAVRAMALYDRHAIIGE